MAQVAPVGPQPRRSRLLLVGTVLVLMAVVIPRPLMTLAEQTPPGLLRPIALIFTDVFRLCFFAGLGCWIIGALRNRRWRKEAEAPKAELVP
jgi:hypothetical protein